ncbi:MAG: arylsulfatase [Blastopirellula sp.]|nr:MAG: arylsulfatase [Blastopirellula sp.]
MKPISLFVIIFLSVSCFGAERPNILLVLVDDMGFSDIGCYGGEINTPNLDKLASSGIRYTAMRNTAKCYTTRASLISGLYFQRTDREFSHTATLGEVLRPSGYHTFWSGKHHATFIPTTRGFDRFYGLVGGACNFWNPGGTPRPGEKEAARKSSASWVVDGQFQKDYSPEDKNWYATDAITDTALNWLKETEDDGKPFFLYMAYTAPHYPLHAWPEDIAKYEGVYDAGYDAIRSARYKRQLEMGLFNAKTTPLSEATPKVPWNELSAEEKKKEIRCMEIYAAMIDRVDQNLGRVFDQLKRTGKFDNTLVLFLSDNGACAEQPTKFIGDVSGELGGLNSFPTVGPSWANVSNTPFRFYKKDSYEGGINTPMIAHWPNGIKQKGSFFRETCHLIDIMPTCIELAGAAYPGESPTPHVKPPDGVSIQPSFTGKSLNRSKPLFWEFGGGAATQQGDMKLVRKKTWELYDLSKDRTETVNLAGKLPKHAAHMEAQWHAWFKECTGMNYAAYKAKLESNKTSNKKSSP